MQLEIIVKDPLDHRAFQGAVIL